MPTSFAKLAVYFNNEAPATAAAIVPGALLVNLSKAPPITPRPFPVIPNADAILTLNTSKKFVCKPSI